MTTANLRGTIITFYSYKGGTGRSMALANVACLLAQLHDADKGNVLMIDWDLEAPGLHEFFRPWIKGGVTNVNGRGCTLDEHPGLIDLFEDLDAAIDESSVIGEAQIEEATRRIVHNAVLDQFIIETTVPNLYLLKAGRFDSAYASRVNNFRWEVFLSRLPSLFRLFVERLAEQYGMCQAFETTGCGI
jgi:eukaryotic-like serine/threonine-protein kinase